MPGKTVLFCCSCRALLQNSPILAGSFAKQPAKTRLFCLFSWDHQATRKQENNSYHKTRALLLQTSPTRSGLSCKRALQIHGSFAKKLYKYRFPFHTQPCKHRSLLRKKPTNVLLLCMKVLQMQGSFAKEPRSQREYGKKLPHHI